METVNITLTGKQFQHDDPEHYMETVQAHKHKDERGEVYYVFGDGAFVGYPTDSEFGESYGVVEVDDIDNHDTVE